MHDSVALNSYVSISNSFSLSGVLITSLGTGRRVKAGIQILTAYLVAVPTFTAVELKKTSTG